MSRRSASRTPAPAKVSTPTKPPTPGRKTTPTSVSAPVKPGPRRGNTPAPPAVGARSFTRGARDARRRAARKRAPGEQRPLGEILRSQLRRVPRAAWVCALVAFLNAACWSVISPPFEVPDEPSHFAYVQRLAETGKLPTSSAETFPLGEYTILNDLRYSQVRYHSEQGTISSPAAQRKLESDLAKPLATEGEGSTGVSASQPPLYYAIETIPYALGSAGNLLDQDVLMRLLSALMGGVTALFVFLFVREALPGARWAWTVGGLGVALTPLLGEMSGAINPDAMLFAVSAALFYCLARGFRRGITPRLAAATGAVLAVGVCTKLNFDGLVPGAILGVLALCAIEWRSSRPSAYRCLALAFGIGASPILLYGIVNLFSGQPAGGAFSAVVSFARKGGSLPGELAYIWQFYLPRLPGMSADFHGILTTRLFWFNGLVGLYGWLDATFPKWVYTAALIPAGALTLLLARGLVMYRGALVSRALELGVYAAMGLGLLVLIGADDYVHQIPGEYAEPRYLLPLLALWGALLALAARGAGRRWGPIVGVAIVSVVLAHDIFSQLLVISRYYG
jgi:Predicted membrane protein (DUF2142)